MSFGIAGLSLSQTKPRLPAHFTPDREVHVIISTLSGDQTALEYYQKTLEPFLTSRISHLKLKENYFVHTTTSSTSIAHLTKNLFLFNAKKGVKQTLILLSGDGGIVDIVNTLTTTLQREIDDSRPPSIFFKPVICLVPCGTANALAWSLNVAHDPLKMIWEGRARALPQFEVTFSKQAMLVTDEGRQQRPFVSAGARDENRSDGRTIVGSQQTDLAGQEGYFDPDGNVRIYGCVVFSWGLHASLVALSDTTEKRKHGIDRFKFAAQELIEEGHVYKGQVKIRKDRHGKWERLNNADDDRHSYILATLVSNLEEKFRISPASRPLDGVLRLISIDATEPAEKLSATMMQAYDNGKHVESDTVTYEAIDGLRIDFTDEEDQWRQICVDGKIVIIEKGGFVEVRNMAAGGVDGRRVVEVVS